MLGDYALLQVVRVQSFIATSARTQAVLAWVAANPLALCGTGVGIGGAAYYFSGNRSYGDAAIGALEGCEAGLSIAEIGDLLRGPNSRPNAGPDRIDAEPGTVSNGAGSASRDFSNNPADLANPVPQRGDVMGLKSFLTFGQFAASPIGKVSDLGVLLFFLFPIGVCLSVVGGLFLLDWSMGTKLWQPNST